MTHLDPRTDTSAFWDQRFQAADFLYGTRPNAFLVDQAYRLAPGQNVLAVADGEGRNGVWLATQGYKVVTVDASPRGLQKSAKLALDNGVSLTTICADLRTWDWPQQAYDAVVSIYFHMWPDDRRMIHPRLLTALRPGGVLILEAFHPEHQAYRTYGPKDPATLYAVEDLAADFAGAEIEILEPAVVTLDEGKGHHGEAAVVRMVARRPETADTPA